MDQTAFRCYRFSKTDPPAQQVASFTVSAGHAPEIIVAHPYDRDQVAQAIQLPVETLSFGGPLRGELWLS